MVKSEFIRALHEKLPERQVSDVELAVNCLLKHMAAALINGERIEIRDLAVSIYTTGLRVWPAIPRPVQRLSYRQK